MQKTILRYAKLNKDTEDGIHQLEQQSGKVILVLEPTNESPYADLNPQALTQVQELERKLGVILIAYKVTQE